MSASTLFHHVADVDARPRIAIVTTARGWGGLEMNQLRLAVDLAARGHTVYLLAPPDTTTFQKLPDRPAPNGVIKVAIGQHWAYMDLVSAYRLGRQLRHLGVSSVLFFHNRDMDVLSWAKRLVYRRLRLTYINSMQVGVPKRSWLHRLRQGALDYWVDHLEYLAALTKERTHIQPEQHRLIPVPLSASALARATPRLGELGTKQTAQRQARIELGLPDIPQAGPHLLVLGRIEPGKRQHLLLEGVAQLPEPARSQVQILIAGATTAGHTGGYPNQLEALAQKLGLEGQMHLRPFRPDPSVYLTAADALVMPTTGESIGMVTLEAQLAGLPVIGSRSGGTADLLAKGRGLLFAPDDPASLAEALTAYLEDRDGWRERARALAPTVAEAYAPSRTVGQIERLAMVEAPGPVCVPACWSTSQPTP